MSSRYFAAPAGSTRRWPWRGNDAAPQFDPELVEVFCDRVSMLFSDVEGATSWDLVIDAEPSLARRCPAGSSMMHLRRSESSPS
jgi:hypothetical protein